MFKRARTARRPRDERLWVFHVLTITQRGRVDAFTNFITWYCIYLLLICKVIDREGSVHWLTPWFCNGELSASMMYRLLQLSISNCLGRAVLSAVSVNCRRVGIWRCSFYAHHFWKSDICSSSRVSVLREKSFRCHHTICYGEEQLTIKLYK